MKQKPFNNPFEALAQQREKLPPGPTAQRASPGPTAKAGPVRAVVRMERKGRRGKEVTVVEQLALGTRELERWCTALKKTLGCGGTVEKDTLVLQGDHRERVEQLLLARGVKKVSLG
jgi:translation initiation factor 1